MKSVALNSASIQKALDTAKSKGLKSPKLRAGKFLFSFAPMDGRNAGSIYVKYQHSNTEILYAGKITSGIFYPVPVAPESVIAELQDISNNLSESIVAYGRRTGECGCCGRMLVDPVSVSMGIGPICAEKFGLAGLRETVREELNAEKAEQQIKLEDL